MKKSNYYIAIGLFVFVAVALYMVFFTDAHLFIIPAFIAAFRAMVFLADSKNTAVQGR